VHEVRREPSKARWLLACAISAALVGVFGVVWVLASGQHDPAPDPQHRPAPGPQHQLAPASLLAGPGWQTIPVSACRGTAVTPATDVQAAIDRARSGTTFCFGRGIYRVSSLVPKSHDVLNGGGKAVLDGGNSAQFAIYGDRTAPVGVTIEGFTIQHYNTPLQYGAVQDYNGAHWTIQDNDIEHNAAAAVATGNYARVLHNKLDNNFQEGYSVHGTGALYQNNDISYNNTARSDCGNHGPCVGWEAGGGKGSFTTHVTMDGNTIIGNGCNGIWFDTDNYGTVIENNVVKQNCGAGIYEEQSFNFTIKGNVVEGNGLRDSPGGGQRIGWAWDAGIQIRRSGCINGATCVISGNTVKDNYNGISLIDSPIDATGGAGIPLPYGNFYVQNVLVEGNFVTMGQGATGAYQDGAGNAVFTSSHNVFRGNRYCVASAVHPADGYAHGWFAWLNRWVDIPASRDPGPEAGGTFGIDGACNFP
jgi:hypothetical protein